MKVLSAYSRSGRAAGIIATRLLEAVQALILLKVTTSSLRALGVARAVMRRIIYVFYKGKS